MSLVIDVLYATFDVELIFAPPRRKFESTGKKGETFKWQALI
jgi:hypothetical protein